MRHALTRRAAAVERCVLALVLCWTVTAQGQEAKMTPLFDGQTLAGWEGDRGTWRAENGALVGGTLSNAIERNSFLCTLASFANFELRVTARIAGGTNLGVAFRAERVAA